VSRIAAWGHRPGIRAPGSPVGVGSRERAEAIDGVERWRAESGAFILGGLLPRRRRRPRSGGEKPDHARERRATRARETEEMARRKR